MKQKLTIFLSTLYIIGSIAYTNAQATLINPFAGSYFQPSAGINVGTVFNNKDLLLDIGVGYEELGYDFSITLNGMFRPYYKTIMLEDDGYFSQLKDKSVQFSVDLEKRFFFLHFLQHNKLGLYAALKMGWSYELYKGYSKFQNNRFVFNPSAGLSWQFSKSTRVSAGYLYHYQNLYAPAHMGIVKLSLYIPNNKED